MITRRFLMDTGERVLATFIQAFCGLIIAAGSSTLNMATVRAAGIAGLIASLSVVKATVTLWLVPQSRRASTMGVNDVEV